MDLRVAIGKRETACIPMEGCRNVHPGFGRRLIGIIRFHGNSEESIIDRPFAFVQDNKSVRRTRPCHLGGLVIYKVVATPTYSDIRLHRHASHYETAIAILAHIART